jgi:hypothetical protein
VVEGLSAKFVFMVGFSSKSSGVTLTTKVILVCDSDFELLEKLVDA